MLGGATQTQRCVQNSEVNFVFGNRYAGTAQERQRLNRGAIIIVFILSSQKNYCIAQFKVSFSSGEKAAQA